ncbi:MAG: efflux RND transporter periplasmic adaptor subunit [Bacteroidetes bacterium]|nr:efflux RND transporter periplasmic adaptor subunit [Bacteroidota bacterium]
MLSTLQKIVPCCALAGLLLAACEEKKPAEKKPEKFCLSDTIKHRISIDSARICSIDEELHLSGEVSFDENKIVKVFPNSSGQVADVKVTLGDKVQAGQVLAVIKSADVAGNYSDLASAEADIKIAKRQMDNQESLFNSGLASQKEYEDAKLQYDKAVAVRNKIQSLISINGGGNMQAGGMYYIKAPISGYIVEKKVNAGNFIRQDMTDNMFTISDLKDVWVWANVYEADISKVREGFSAMVTTLAYPDKKFPGRIDKVSNVLDPSNKVMRIRIRLSNEGLLLKPEMFTNVIISHVSDQQATCIPVSSLVEENSQTFVILYNNDCDLSVAQVEVMKKTGEKAFLKSGVNPGQKLITHNALLIYDEFTDNAK